MNPHTMTLTEILDEFARIKGWREVPDSAFSSWYRGDRKSPDCEYTDHDDHPLPPTLDTIAGLLPEGWTWTRRYADDMFMRWFAMSPTGVCVSVPDTGDEKLDRARLALAAVLAASKGAT